MKLVLNELELEEAVRLYLKDRGPINASWKIPVLFMRDGEILAETELENEPRRGQFAAPPIDSVIYGHLLCGCIGEKHDRFCTAGLDEGAAGRKLEAAMEVVLEKAGLAGGRYTWEGDKLWDYGAAKKKTVEDFGAATWQIDPAVAVPDWEKGSFTNTRVAAEVPEPWKFVCLRCGEQIPPGVAHYPGFWNSVSTGCIIEHHKTEPAEPTCSWCGEEIAPNTNHIPQGPNEPCDVLTDFGGEPPFRSWPGLEPPTVDALLTQLTAEAQENNLGYSRIKTGAVLTVPSAVTGNLATMANTTVQMQDAPMHQYTSRQRGSRSFAPIDDLDV